MSSETAQTLIPLSTTMRMAGMATRAMATKTDRVPVIALFLLIHRHCGLFANNRCSYGKRGVVGLHPPPTSDWVSSQYRQQQRRSQEALGEFYYSTTLRFFFHSLVVIAIQIIEDIHVNEAINARGLTFP
jgi:hypothetical protein